MIQIPTVREAFGINIPSVYDISIICAFGLLVLIIIEATKVVLRKKAPVARKIGT